MLRLFSDYHTESDTLASIADKHIRGKKNYIREIHSVLTLEAVERLLMRNFQDL